MPDKIHARQDDGNLQSLTEQRNDSEDLLQALLGRYPDLLAGDQIDEVARGEHLAKRVILEIYDEMQRGMETGEPYQTRLDPPPTDPRVAHPARPLEREEQSKS